MKWKFKKLSNFFYHLCNTSVPLWFFVYQSIFNLSFLVTTFCSNWSFLFYHFSSEAHLSFQGREVRKVSVILQQGRNMVLVNVADKKTWKSKFLNENFFMCTTHCVVLVKHYNFFNKTRIIINGWFTRVGIAMALGKISFFSILARLWKRTKNKNPFIACSAVCVFSSCECFERYQ
jgi:hypothetical protein